MYGKSGEKYMDWLKKHADSVATIATVVGAVVWMQGRMDTRFNQLEKDIAIIKTVLVMKDILPKELATNVER